MLLFLGSRMQAKIILILAMIILFYPLLRSQDFFPYSMLTDVAQSIDEERAQSLTFRLDNEEVLLEKARERIWFGWGSWGRHHIFDPITGHDLSVIDGYWVIIIGQLGLVGFICYFGLLLLPIIRVARSVRFLPVGRERTLVLTLTLLVLIRALDLLPNAFFAPITLFVAGALFQFTGLSKKSATKSGESG